MQILLEDGGHGTEEDATEGLATKVAIVAAKREIMHVFKSRNMFCNALYMWCLYVFDFNKV